jgi:type IV pilus secretin PilQ/predicted competence protein
MVTPRVIALTVLVLSTLSGGIARAQETCLDQLPPEPKARLEQQRISLNLRDANIATTLRLLAQQYKLNMLITDDVTGNITLDFFQVPARDVFKAIIDSARLDCSAVGNSLRVSTSKRVRAEQEERAKLDAEESKRVAELRKAEADQRRAQEEAEARREARIADAEARRAEAEAHGPVREETIRLRYADAEEVARTILGILGLRPLSGGFSAAAVPLPQLSQLYAPSPPTEIPSTPQPPQTLPVPEAPQSPDVLAKGLTIGFYKRTNSVFIRYYARDLERIKALITEKLDIPVAQIQITAQMVITTLNALDQIGVQWGGGKATNVGNGSVFVGQGFSTPPSLVSQAGSGQGGTTVGGTTQAGATQGGNQGGTPISTVPPPAPPNLISPATVGNLVNLPTAFLPTVIGANPAAGLLLGLIGQNFNITLAIQALEAQGRARTLAVPKAVTVENAKAVISRGFEVPFTSTPSQGVQQVQFKDALLKLEVTPRLIREDTGNKIRMNVVFDNDAPDFTQLVQGNPSIFKRRQETEVLISEGQRLVIGGVTNDVTSTTTRQVPGLGTIPVLGWLFKSREVSSTGEELIVIITPTIVSDPAATAKR